jgi:hypothetical protein
MAFARQHSADEPPQGLSRPACMTLAVPTSKPVSRVRFPWPTTANVHG